MSDLFGAAMDSVGNVYFGASNCIFKLDRDASKSAAERVPSNPHDTAMPSATGILGETKVEFW